MLLYDSSCIVNGGKAGSVQKKKRRETGSNSCYNKGLLDSELLDGRGALLLRLRWMHWVVFHNGFTFLLS